MRCTPIAALVIIGSACGGGDGAGGTDAASPTDAAGDTDARPADAHVPCVATAPTLVDSVTGAVVPAPDGYAGGTAAQLDLDGPDANWTWNDPHVLRVGAEYWMYASATDAFEFPVKIYRLVSSDGVSWTRNPLEPVLEPGAPGSFDAGGVETPAVVYFDDAFHMFYTAYPTDIDDPGHSVLDFRVGHATSCDGINWTRVVGNPVVAPTGDDDEPGNDWYAFVVGEPGPVVYRDELLLYFTAVGANAELGTSLEVIGVTRSTDATLWSPPQIALEPDQAQYPRVIDPGPPIDGWVGYSTPNAMVLNEQVHLFFDVAYDPDEASWQQIRLHHAASPDGVGSWQQDPSPIASAGDFPYAVDEIRSPHALVDGTTLRLYFAGHELDGIQPEHFAIGMLSAPLLP